MWDIRLLRDLVHLWGDAALLFFIPALIVGAVIGRFVGRWLLCVLLSYAAAIALLALTRVQQGFRHPPSLIELLVYSAVFALPPILALASAGYLLGRKLKERRERRLLTQSSHSALPRGIRDASIAHRSLASGTSSMNRFDRYEPGQFVRFLWFIAIMFVPPGAVAYVFWNGLEESSEKSLTPVVLILAGSFAIIVICAIAQPIKRVDQRSFVNLGHGCLCFAIFITSITVVPSLVRQPCYLETGCHPHLLAGVAMAGMYVCYAAWCYLTIYFHAR